MTILPILHYPDQRLYKNAKPVTYIDDRIKKLLHNMAETMYSASGIGLAATQVNVHERIIVIDVSKECNKLQVLINPEIIWKSNKKQVYKEGCLSIPGIYENIERSAYIHCKALDENGCSYTFEADNILSTCIQHEVDHLNGKIFIEYLSKFKKNRIKMQLRNLELEQEIYKN